LLKFNLILIFISYLQRKPSCALEPTYVIELNSVRGGGGVFFFSHSVLFLFSDTKTQGRSKSLTSRLWVLNETVIRVLKAQNLVRFLHLFVLVLC